MFKQASNVCCGNCLFFGEDDRCYRYPPKIVLIPADHETYGDGFVEVEYVYPFIADSSDDWCGEFKHKGPSDA